MKRLVVGILAMVALCLLLAGPTLAYSSTSRTSSAPDANQRARVWIQIQYNYVKVKGSDQDWGVQFTKCLTKWTSIDSRYYVAYIDMSCGAFVKGSCTSTGSNPTWNAHHHTQAWREPLSRAPTVNVWYGEFPSFSNHWDIVSIDSAFEIWGNAVAHIYNKTSGASAGTATATVSYGGG